ncbi:HNH endonuclease [Micromonospora sp. STR1s_5]|nr:HNH endonuclease [Micromonospora sp. STR1s_5]
MPVPDHISAWHVEQAFVRVRADGIPPGAQSTKFDVLDPSDGSPFPPKLILSVAAELARGFSLSRTEFSGGEMTNSRLRELGFEIVEKRRRANLTVRVLEPGAVLTNDDLVTAFSVGNTGGMRWSSTENCLVLVADHTKSLYDDRWVGDALFYTGMGRLGHQTLTGQNLRLARQQETGVALHLFEVFTPNAYTYVGRVELSGSFLEETQPDADGALRKVLVFPLRLAAGARKVQPRIEQLERIEATRTRALRSRSTARLLALARGSANPSSREIVSRQFTRSLAVALLVKRSAAGTCDLCGQPAPFNTADGPFLECHHIVHLAQGGPDTIENTVALCPNCHRRMHALNHETDRRRLLRRVAARIIDA